MKNSGVFVRRLMMICNKAEADCTIFITLCKLRRLETGSIAQLARSLAYLTQPPHHATDKYSYIYVHAQQQQHDESR